MSYRIVQLEPMYDSHLLQQCRRDNNQRRTVILVLGGWVLRHKRKDLHCLAKAHLITNDVMNCAMPLRMRLLTRVYHLYTEF